MGRDYLHCLALVYVTDNCPDIVMLQAMDNNLDVDGPINEMVEDQVRFAVDWVPLMGGIKIVIGTPLHHRRPRHLSSEAFKANVNKAITLLHHRLVDPAFATIKHLDMRAFIIQNVVLCEHRKLSRPAASRWGSPDWGGPSPSLAQLQNHHPSACMISS